MSREAVAPCWPRPSALLPSRVPLLTAPSPRRPLCPFLSLLGERQCQLVLDGPLETGKRWGAVSSCLRF